MLDQNFPAAVVFYLIENFRVRKSTFISPQQRLWRFSFGKRRCLAAETESTFAVGKYSFERSEINYSFPLTSSQKTVIIIKKPPEVRL